jgi:hypothetical protein
MRRFRELFPACDLSHFFALQRLANGGERVLSVLAPAFSHKRPSLHDSIRLPQNDLHARPNSLFPAVKSHSAGKTENKK